MDRVFVAIELDPDVRHGLAAHLSAHVPELPGRAAPPDNWHLTLRFVGAVEPVELEWLMGALDETELGGSFRIGFGGLGAFPRPKRAAVVWVAITKGVEEVEDLAGRVESATALAGFPNEERPFHPHVTISRIRPPADVTELVAETPPFPLTQDVVDIVLFRSHLGGGPARYEALERFLL